MSAISTTQPHIVAYWTGYEKLDFNPGVATIPAYVKDIDVLILAFALVQNGTIQYTCAAGETCLCNGPGYWTEAEIKQWLGNIRAACPNIKIVLPVGGWAYCDWNSVTDATTFATNMVERLGDWTGLIDGLDIDYEQGAGTTTPLPGNISFYSVIQALINEMQTRLPGNPVLSLPYYGGSPWQPADLAPLKDSISFVSTMGYGADTYDYQNLLQNGYRATNGFSNSSMAPSAVTTFIQSNSIKAAMFWNLCEDANGTPAEYVEAIKAGLRE
jgi:GH18 family chitinase